VGHALCGPKIGARSMSLVQAGTLTSSVVLREEGGVLPGPKPDPYFMTSFLAVMLLMSAAALFLVIFPELHHFNRAASDAASNGCTPLRGPFMGLKLATGDPQQPFPTSGPTTPSTPGSTFCPDLVVPDDCHCTLIVPVRPLSHGPFNVVNVDGSVMLRVLPHAAVPEKPPEGTDTPEPPAKRLFTLTTRQGAVLAHCCEAGRQRFGHPGRSAQFLLVKACGQTFAFLSFGREPNRFILATDSGPALAFFGMADYSAIRVNNLEGRRVAAMKMCKCSFDPTGDYCCLRAEPLADMGLVLCSLLCINHLGDEAL